METVTILNGHLHNDLHFEVQRHGGERTLLNYLSTSTSGHNIAVTVLETIRLRPRSASRAPGSCPQPREPLTAEQEGLVRGELRQRVSTNLPTGLETPQKVPSKFLSQDYQ